MGNILIENVSKIYQGHGKAACEVLAVDNVSLEILDKEIVSVVGPSGCGKTTLLNMIAGFDAISEGWIRAAGKDIQGVGPDRMVVFQRPALFPWMTVYENVVFGPVKRGIPESQYKPNSERFIEAVGLTGFVSHYPYQLSGGMQQRVQIARALVNCPDVLLMDEPFGALDFQTRLLMQELLLRVWAEFQPTIMFITHDIEEAVFISDRVMVMSERPGKILETLNIGFPKPRDFEILASLEFVTIKDRILHLIRGGRSAVEEERKSRKKIYRI